MMTTFRLILLTGLIVCAAATALTKKPMQAVIIYMAYSVIMSVMAILWSILQSPDLAITEAAVGAGITSLLLFLTLRRLNLIDRDEEHRRHEEETLRQHAAPHETHGEEDSHEQ